MDEKTIHDRRWLTLGVLCLSLVAVILANTTLNVALPTLQRDLGASSTSLQWIVDAYALVFAGLLLTAGALGDRFGRKGALIVGLIIFGSASAVSSLAGSAGQLIVTRAIMGIGAALVMPATLSILTTVFPPHERGKAIGIWAGLAGAGAALGPITSGWLLENFWWGSVFLINVPVVLIALVLGRSLVPSSKDPAQPPLDPIGALLSIAGLGLLLYAIIEAPTHGWTDVRTLAVAAAAAVVLGGFAAWELRSTHPMLDLHLFRNPSFSAASGAITLVFFAMFGTFFMLTQYFQLVMGYSALEAGVRTLPMPLTMMLAAPMSAKLVHHFGARRVVTAGLTTVGLGLLLLSRADVGTPYVLIGVSLVILASGMGLSMAPATTTIMASTPRGKAGVGSAVNDTTRELGGALGVAVLGSILASGFRSGVESGFGPLPESAQAAVTSGLGTTLAAAGDIGGEAGARLADAARHAFANAMSNGMLVAATVALLAAAVVARYFPVHVRRTETGADAAPVRERATIEPAPRPEWVSAGAEARR